MDAVDRLTYLQLQELYRLIFDTGVSKFSTVEGFKDLFKRLHTFALSADQATVS
ncbi:unnamed protein product, partial [Pylaiella littoralis]